MRLYNRALIVCALALSSSASPALALTPMNPGQLLELYKRRYLDELYRAKPHLATFMGIHAHDGELPDYSPEALRRREAELKAIAGDAAALPRAQLTVDQAIDLAVLLDGIKLEQLYLTEIKDWSWDPRWEDSFPFYDPRDVLSGRLSDILHGGYAPEAERRKAVVAQLQAMPRFVAGKQAAVTAAGAPPSICLAQAVKGNRGTIEFFNTEVKEFVAQDPAGEKARVAAVTALEGYQKFLESGTPRGTPRDWRLGAALYRKKFPLALQTDLTPEQVVPRAEASFQQARAELYAVAAKLHRQLWPQEPAPPAGDKADARTQAKVINRVKDEITKEHPKAAELVAAHAGNLDRLRAFIEKHDLVELPPKETLVVEPMPAFKRGVTAAEYLAPGMLDHTTAWRATYYVDPVDPTWPADKVESYLRGSNTVDNELTAAHEAYPGHHTQAFHQRKDNNALRSTLWNPAFAEGWAVYGEEMLVDLGYGGARNDRYRFVDLQGHLVVAANILLDIKLHSGQMSDEEAVRFMVEDGFQEQARADKKLVRAKLDSTQLAQYFLGYSEIKDLEADWRKKVGKAPKQRQFNEALVGHGSIAVKHLRTYLLGGGR